MRPEHVPPPRALAARLLAAALLLAATGAAQQLTLDGRLETSAGGFRFGDGTLQTTAASGTADYAGILVVDSRGGGDFTTIQGAIDAVGTALPAASAANRYLVRVAPGTYSEQVTMQEWVDLEGAGEGATTVTWTGSNVEENAHTLEAANNAELRFLTVANTGGAFYARGVIASSGDSSRRLYLVTVDVSGAGTSVGVLVSGGSAALLRGVTVRVTGNPGGDARAFQIEDSAPTLLDVNAFASGALDNAGLYISGAAAAPIIRGGATEASNASGSQRAVQLVGASATIVGLAMHASGGGSAIALRAEGTASRATRVQGSRLEAAGGAFNVAVRTTSSQPLRFHGSAIVVSGPGATTSLDADSGSEIDVAASLVDGFVQSGGTYVCIASFNESFATIGTNCL